MVFEQLLKVGDDSGSKDYIAIISILNKFYDNLIVKN
jgi:hypothetical protein